MRFSVFSSSILAIVICAGAKPSLADLVLDPPHPHAGANVVTWNDGHNPIGTHQHNHRTGHDPMAGLFVHGGVAFYNTAGANWVWVGRTLVTTGGAGHGGFPGEFAHGHQGHSPDGSNVQPAGRYHIHEVNPKGEGDISVAEAAAWNANASARVSDAFNGVGEDGLGWLDIGNAGGLKNWPGTNTDGAHDPAGGGDPPAGTGVPWHSSVKWVESDDREDHEVHVVYGEAGLGNLAITTGFLGHRDPGSGSMTITIDDDVMWYYPTDGMVPAGQQDFQTIMLHETGHVLGLGHFGTLAAKYIMQGGGFPTGPAGVLHTIDPDAIHGIRDLYAIAAPAPGSLALLAFSGLLGRRRRRR